MLYFEISQNQMNSTSDKLAKVKAAQQPEEGREERISRSLEALRSAPPTVLTLEQWREILAEAIE